MTGDLSGSKCTDCDYDGREDNDAFYGVSADQHLETALMWAPITPHLRDQRHQNRLADRPVSSGGPVRPHRQRGSRFPSGVHQQGRRILLQEAWIP